MSVYVRHDSPFYWLLLERPGQPPKREGTTIPIDGGSPALNKELKRQAQALYAKRMVDLTRQRHQMPVTRETRTFADQRSWYLEHVSAHKRGVTRERSMLKQLGVFFDAYALTQIDQALAREWRTQRLTEVSASTVRREEEILKHLLNTAVPKYLEASPLKGLQRVRVPETDTRVLTIDEETRLLRAVTSPEDRALLIGAIDTLLRLSNIAGLTRAQDHHMYLFSDTKVGAVKIPISRRLRQALDALHGTGAYFPSYSTLASRNNRVIRMFREACARAKVATGRKTGGVSFHCLRHTGASRMLAAGVDVKTVMEIGGWKNLAVMQRYLHPTDQRKQDAVNSIGKHVVLTRRKKSHKRLRKTA